MIYGIDLGTTNSLICCAETNFISDLVPSCVDFSTGICGKQAYDNMNATRSFKIDMSLGEEGRTPRVASTYVLKELAKQIPGEDVHDVVISVPAYFTDNQRQATIESAKNAGFNVVSLINEPTAAAMYIARNRHSLFAVFDLGGGTFDISIIDSRFGTYDVQGTSGRIIGGDNFDMNIMRFLVKRGGITLFRLDEVQRNSLKHYATKLKILMQKSRKSLDVDLSAWNGGKIVFTEEDYIYIMKTTFQDTITCTKQLIAEHVQDEPYEILLVGGSTRCPYLREWISEEFSCTLPEITYDPDKVVAQGAAMYAAMWADGSAAVKVSDVTRALSVGLHDGTVSRLVEPNSKIPLQVEKVFYNPVAADELILDLYQGESVFASDNEKIGQLIWKYDTPREAMNGQVVARISIDNAGVITFSCNELLHEPVTVTLRRNL